MGHVLSVVELSHFGETAGHWSACPQGEEVNSKGGGVRLILSSSSAFVVWFSFVLKSYEFISEVLVPKYKPRNALQSCVVCGGVEAQGGLKSKCSPYKANEAVFVGSAPVPSLIVEL